MGVPIEEETGEICVKRERIRGGRKGQGRGSSIGSAGGVADRTKAGRRLQALWLVEIDGLVQWGKTRWSSVWLRGGSGKIPRGMVSGWRRRDGTRGRIFRVRLELIYI